MAPLPRVEPEISPPKQDQPEPGLDADLEPKTDRGEESYRGTGRLEGRKALITGADSGIGAAVAIAFAREGADVALSYLPEEEEDAQLRISRICPMSSGSTRSTSTFTRSTESRRKRSSTCLPAPRS